MTFICILCGGLQILMLLSITGVLMSLAALSRLMELTFVIISPLILFMLRQSMRLVLHRQMEVMLSDLGDKAPWLSSLFRPEYSPYFNTAGTVLLGWMLVCWLSHFVCTFLAPLIISVIAIVIICPSTAQWLVSYLGPIVEQALTNLISKIRFSVPEFR